MEDKFLKVAKQAALEAGKVISKYAGQRYKLTIKGGDSSDFATRADLEAERVIVKILSNYFPTHNIIAEEESNINKSSNYTWAIDPIDGTISYVAGLPTFTVSIGLLKNYQPILGVIYHVSAKDLYFAEKGKGAFLNGRKININRRENILENAVLSIDLGHKKSRPEKFRRYVNPLSFKVGYIYNLGSGVLSFAYTASGIFSGHILSGCVWDVLAGTVIVREAGGRVTDFEGNEPDWTKERLNIVASNGLIHQQILEALRS